MSVDTPSVLSWNTQFQQAIRDPLQLCDSLELPDSFRAPAVRAAELFPVFAPLNYVQRMRSGDTDDPLLRQVLPIDAEFDQIAGFVPDPVGDQAAKHRPGLIQKYAGRVLFMTTGLCAVHCRYCFRRHYPYQEDPHSLAQWKPALEYVANDESIHEVILSGGDPLSLTDARLEGLLMLLSEMPHLERLRVHTRLPIVIPDRITDGLLACLANSRLQGYFVVHANHVNELSPQVLRQLARVREAGLVLLNQAVLLRGVNDDVEALVNLCERLSDHGVLPYYLHQLDRVQGAAHFEVPVARGRALVEQLRQRLPGYAVPRYVEEIAGAPNKQVLL